MTTTLRIFLLLKHDPHLWTYPIEHGTESHSDPRSIVAGHPGAPGCQPGPAARPEPAHATRAAPPGGGGGSDEVEVGEREVRHRDPGEDRKIGWRVDSGVPAPIDGGVGDVHPLGRVVPDDEIGLSAG